MDGLVCMVYRTSNERKSKLVGSKNIIRKSVKTGISKISRKLASITIFQNLQIALGNWRMHNVIGCSNREEPKKNT